VVKHCTVVEAADHSRKLFQTDRRVDLEADSKADMALVGVTDKAELKVQSLDTAGIAPHLQVTDKDLKNCHTLQAVPGLHIA
jgi:hypothetical protein